MDNNRITNDNDGHIPRGSGPPAPSDSSGSPTSSSVRLRQSATHGLPDESWLSPSLSDAPFRSLSSSSSFSSDLFDHRAHTAAPTNIGWGSTSFASSGMPGGGTAMLPEPSVFSQQPVSGLLGGNAAMNATQVSGGRSISGSTPPIYRSCQPPAAHYGWDMANLYFQPCDPYFPMDIAKHRIPSDEREAALRGMQAAFQQLSIQVDFENNPVGARLRTDENIELYLDLFEAADDSLLMDIQVQRGDYLDANRYIHKIVDAAKGINGEETVNTSTHDIQMIMEHERFLKDCSASSYQAFRQAEPPFMGNHMGAPEDVETSPIGGMPPILTLEGINYLALPLGEGSDLVIRLQSLRQFAEVATRHQWLHYPGNNLDQPTTEARVRQIFRDLVGAIRRAHRIFGLRSLNFDPSKILVHLNGNASSLSAILVPIGYPTSGRFAAPEMLAKLVNQQQYNSIAANSWSLGVILLELLTGDSIYHHPSPHDPLYCFWIECAGIAHTDIPLQIARNMAANATNGIQNNHRIQQFLRTVETVHELSYEAKALLTSLLQKDPARRPSAQQILHHPWF